MVISTSSMTTRGISCLLALPSRICPFLFKFVSPYNEISRNFCSKACMPSVASKIMVFQGQNDLHKGFIVDSRTNFCNDTAEFRAKLEVSLEKWASDQLKGIWFKVAVPQIEWIPLLIEKGFKIHHASEEVIHLYLWLPKNEECKVPPYAHNMIGAGAAVINEQNKILVVRERIRSIPIWKLPGGYVDRGEDIGEAAMREVLEETSIRTEFMSLLGFRYTKKSIFGCSDMYFIVRLRPLSNTIMKQDSEVEDCQWMDVNTFLSHKEVYVVLRNFVKQALENEKHGIMMGRASTIHPITKVPQLIFSLSHNISSGSA